MRLAIWSPLPPSPSGIADYVAETLPGLSLRADVACVVEDPATVAPISGVRLLRPSEVTGDRLDVYHLGNSPAHAYVYRAACARPGVSFLHDWSLHHLVLRETVERGDISGYLHEMRRGYGEAGSFVGRQVARALGGTLLPALFPLNDRILEGSLGVVGLTSFVHDRARSRAPQRHVLKLPHHLALPLEPPPTRAEARAALGLPEGALVVTAPGLATASKRLDVLIPVIAQLRAAYPQLLLVIAGAALPQLPLAGWAQKAGLGDALRITDRLSMLDFERHLAAADVVSLLRFPSHGEMSGALVRALGVGRPVLVTAGSPAAAELPEGVVVPVDPGRHESAEMLALLDRLLRDASLRERIGRLASEHVRRHHDLAATLDTLVDFLQTLEPQRAALVQTIEQERSEEGSLLGYLTEEVRWGARDIGLAGVSLGIAPALRELVTPAAEGPR